MMKEQILQLLKEGMKAEMDSILLYRYAGDNAGDPTVAEFFQERQNEEQSHFNYLLHHYEQLMAGKEEEEEVWYANPCELERISPALSSEFVKRIGNNQILFSAISTAILLEKNGIDFYRKSAQEATSESIKRLFEMLTTWEESHYNDLLDVQKQAEEFYWQENRFQPF